MRLYTHYVTDLVKKLLYSSLHPFFHFTAMSCHVLSLSLSLYLSFPAYPSIPLSLFTNLCLCPQEVSLTHSLSFSSVLPNLAISLFLPLLSYYLLENVANVL